MYRYIYLSVKHSIKDHLNTATSLAAQQQCQTVGLNKKKDWTRMCILWIVSVRGTEKFSVRISKYLICIVPKEYCALAVCTFW